MCFSVEVEKDLKKIAQRFNAQVSVADLEYFNALAVKGSDVSWVKSALNLSRKPSGNIFKFHDDEGKVFPGTFTFVMVLENNRRILKPMRYRLRPRDSETEIPSKFNVFNARMDSLENRQTWKPLFMNNHALLPFARFYEWVEYEGKKRLISFRPSQHEVMWAPCLWDYWENKENEAGFYSFALITDGPPREIQEMGHDRCPIFLKENLINDWLSPQGKSKSQMYRTLKNQEEVFYLHDWIS